MCSSDLQYIDVQASTTLVAAPGGTYDMAPAGNWDMPVPPADGLWSAAEAGDGDPPPADPPAAADPAEPPLHLMTGTGTAEDEEN